MSGNGASRYAERRIERAMRSTTRIALQLTLLALVAACAAPLTPNDEAAVSAVFELLKHHDFAAIETRMPPRLRTAVTDARLGAQAAKIPDAEPRRIKSIVAQTTDLSGGSRQISDTREYFYPDRMLVVSTALLESPGHPPAVLALDVRPFSASALASGRFQLLGRNSNEYFLLGLAIAVPLLLTYALLRLAFDDRSRWKWLWAPFILIGWTQLSVNWATGAIVFQSFSLLLLGASIGRGPLDISPWVVTVSLPLGAFIYLARVGFAAPLEDRSEEPG
jgi:hypothetical protein